MRIASNLRLVVSLAWLAACGTEGGEEPTPDDDVAVKIGIPGGDDGLAFEELVSGDELRLQSFGQGGTHVLLGVRCVGFGKRAFVALQMKNMESGVVVRTPAPVRPQLLLCHDERTCDLVPLLAMTSGLTEVGAERDGLRVEISALVRNEAEQRAEAATEAVLSTADL